VGEAALKIDGALRGEVREAILQDFKSVSEFRVVVSEALDRELSEILKQVAEEIDLRLGVAINQTEPELPVAVFDVIRWATRERRLQQLVVAAARYKPTSLRLQALANLLDGSGHGKPQTILKPGLFQPTANWNRKLGQLRRRVCRVEPQPPPDTEGYGTGFLVAPDIVMTNYHVVKKFPKRAVRGEAAIVFRFDYEVGPDGVSIPKSREYGLADEWLLFHSSVGKLDYALVRLNGPPGEHRFGKSLRGYLEPVAHSFTADENLYIFQYPDGKPLSHKVGQVIQPADGDWVTYNVNTQGGSSGSPCTTEDLKVVAIHHWGFEHYNRGVRFAAILKHLKGNRTKLRTKGVIGMLGLGK
jgi:V8-like Glu-specific endopeptidase